MRLKRKEIYIFIFLLIWFVNCFQVSAMNTGYTTETLSKDKQKEIAALLDVRLLTDEPEKRAIECFDVNEKGLVAMGFAKISQSGRRTIAVYSDKGDFQYGYQFKTNGAFYLEWAGDNVIIHIVRGDWVVSVNPVGNVEEIQIVPQTLENSRFRRNVIQAKEKQINDEIYYLKNDMGILNFVASDYSQLWHVTSEDNEILIYDVNDAHFLRKIVWLIGICLFVGMIFLGVRKEFVNLRTKKSGLQRNV